MKLFSILLFGILLTSCRTSKHTISDWCGNKFYLFNTKDTINLHVTYFFRNTTLCYTEAIPYALLIGTTNNPANSKIPKLVTVLAKCDNNVYKIGQDIHVVSIMDPTQPTLRPLFIQKDTMINGKESFWLIGCENPAIWGKVI